MLGELQQWRTVFRWQANLFSKIQMMRNNVAAYPPPTGGRKICGDKWYLKKPYG